MMFPYPSAEGLHVGNMFAFTGSDVYGRFKRLQGYDVFEPIGFDAFGIHSENYAIKLGINPAELIPQNIDNFRRQLRRIGGMFDWRHELSTTDPRYYKWTQWIFLQLFKAGKAYKKAAAVNWCPKDKTVLANEQVIDGRCERCGTMVEQRILEQWFFRITEYADRLLANLDDKTKMDWSESTTTGAAELARPLRGRGDRVPDGRRGGAGRRGARTSARIRVFTTRPDTRLRRHLHGAGAGASAGGRAHHAGAAEAEVEAYRKRGGVEGPGLAQGGRPGEDRCLHRRLRHQPGDRTSRIPVWIADYVLMEYGTGAIMAVPGHDERDFEFAQKFGLPIVAWCVGRAGARDAARRRSRTPYVDNESGLLVNSGQFDGLPVPEAKRAITAWLEPSGAGKGVVQLPAARLVHLAPALLGPADPDHLLRRARRGAGAGEGPAGRAAADRGLRARRQRHLAARPARGVVLRPLSGLRQAEPAGDRRERHLPRLVVVPPALSEHRVRRPAVRPGADEEVAAGAHLHRRQRARGAAPALLPLHHDGAARPRPAATSTSRTGSSGRTG